MANKRSAESSPINEGGNHLSKGPRTEDDTINLMAAPSDVVIIGSFALAHWAPGASRAPADVDLVATSAATAAWLEALRAAGQLQSHSYSHNETKLRVKLTGGLPLDVELVRPGEGSSSADLLALSGPWPRVLIPHAGGLTAAVAPLNVLLAVKQSHLFFAVHWHKHMVDFHALRAMLQDQDQSSDDAQKNHPVADWAPFVAKRRLEAQARYGESKFTSLDVPNEAFFKVWYLKQMVPESVRQAALVDGCEVYTHDELHKLLAYRADRVPLYQTFKRDSTKAALDCQLFEAAPRGDQLRLVREEVQIYNQCCFCAHVWRCRPSDGTFCVLCAAPCCVF